MSVLDELFVELHLFLAAHGINPNPAMHQKDVYTITKHIDFEPNGKASETWEYVWFLVFPWCRYYWRSTTGWRLGTASIPMKFQAASLQLAIRRATVFLIEIQQENVRLGESEIYEAFRKAQDKTLSQDEEETSGKAQRTHDQGEP